MGGRLAATAISLGTYIGGWRIIRTLGHGITKLETPQGFGAETSSAVVILAASQAGYPLSTTHVTSGGVMGAGWASARPQSTGPRRRGWPSPGW